jgi:hypothetical protein
MTEKLLFDVRVQRATPACSENCPNLKIDCDHVEHWSYGTKFNINTFKCMNNEFCANLWRTMRTMMEEKDVGK